MGIADLLTQEDVVDYKTFARYCSQQTGTPYPTGKQIAILRKNIKELFEQYPSMDYHSLCRIVEWSKAKHKRYATPGGMLGGGMRFAWRDGYLPECSPGWVPLDPETEDNIAVAVQKEMYDDAAPADPSWLHRLANSRGNAQRKGVYEQWLLERGPLFGY